MNAPTNIQIINGPDGKPAFVVLPYDEYMRTQRPEPPKSKNGEAMIPHEVVELMIMQDMTPVRAWREYLGMTQADVAARIGISQSAYAQQEAAPKNRKATREKIAAALGISPEVLDV
jgi:ribosome-binding protein aMBF1 (putative translation factor)